MTRAARLAARAAREQAALKVHQQRVAAVHAAQREDTRKTRNKRRYLVGALADEAGLLTWSDGELAAVFAVLTPLADVPNPAAVLAGALGDVPDVSGPSADLAAPICDGVRTTF
jgi:hypothetical protein